MHLECPEKHMDAIVQYFLLDGLMPIASPDEDAQFVQQLAPDDLMNFEGKTILHKRFDAYLDMRASSERDGVERLYDAVFVEQYGDTRAQIRQRIRSHVLRHDCQKAYWRTIDRYAAYQNLSCAAAAGAFSSIADTEASLGNDSVAAAVRKQVYPNRMASKMHLGARRTDLDRVVLALGRR